MNAEAVEAATATAELSTKQWQFFQVLVWLLLFSFNDIKFIECSREKKIKIGILKPGQTFIACDRVER